MKLLNKKGLGMMAVLAGLFLTFSCSEDETSDVQLFEPGQIDATASSASISWGETITYTDLSTKVYERNWVFQGGEPGTSTDSVVNVTYPVGGSYNAILEVTYVDNITETKVFEIEVESNPALEIPEYDYGQTFGLFSEHEDITPGISDIIIQNMNGLPGEYTTDAYEGSEALVFATTGDTDWTMAGLRSADNNELLDISDWTDGYYNFAIRTECLADMLIRIRSTGGGNVIFEFTAEGEEYGWARDGEWHMINIPVADIIANDHNGTLNLSEITEFFLFRSSGGDVRNFDNYVFHLDHIFLSEKVELIE